MNECFSKRYVYNTLSFLAKNHRFLKLTNKTILDDASFTA